MLRQGRGQKGRAGRALTPAEAQPGGAAQIKFALKGYGFRESYVRPPQLDLTDAQKAQWLPKLASGEIRGGLALTEPDAGTDLQGIRMTARREGDHYVINGTKTWITNGVEGSCFALLVKTDPNAQPRHKGMSLFIAPKAEGFTVGRKLEKLGYKSIDSAELVFDNYRVPADCLIGGDATHSRGRAGTRCRI